MEDAKLRIRNSEPEFTKLGPEFDVELLVGFLAHHGDTDFNFLPEDGRRSHFLGLQTGETHVWAAFLDQELVGLITASLGGQFQSPGAGAGAQSPAAEIGDFVVSGDHWGRGIGSGLADAARRSIFECYEPHEVSDLFVMTHRDNTASQRALMKAGWRPLLSFADLHRSRQTTVLKVERPTRVVGIQSGNAVDGIDVCVVEFDEPALHQLSGRDVRSLDYRVLGFDVVPWDHEMREMILSLRDGDQPAVAYAEGNYEMAEKFADAIEATLAKLGIPAQSVDLVSSHGQSILGHPHWEIGELSVLATRLDITTVGDFRPADVAAGGNGSPCTCTYDALMLRPPEGSETWRLCINIGGTTSITFCPPLGSSEEPIGLDPGLGVFFMDLNAQLHESGWDYDDDGALARSGRCNEELLLEMLQYPYFQRLELPISVGAEDFNRELFQRWRQRGLELGCSSADLQATFTELTARTLGLACKRHGPPGGTEDVIVRGKVQHNSYFMERLKANLESTMEVEIPYLKSLEELGIDEEAWETAMYAMFGFLCVRGLHAFEPSCTGAKSRVIAGKICPAGNYSALQLNRGVPNSEVPGRSASSQ